MLWIREEPFSCSVSHGIALWEIAVEHSESDLTLLPAIISTVMCNGSRVYIKAVQIAQVSINVRQHYIVIVDNQRSCVGL